MKNLLLAVALLIPSFACSAVGGAFAELMSTAPEGANAPVPSVPGGPAPAARVTDGDAPLPGVTQPEDTAVGQNSRFTSPYIYASHEEAQAALDLRTVRLQALTYRVLPSSRVLRPNAGRYAYIVEYRPDSSRARMMPRYD